jgi:transglutaminase-like putative cysteine protease
VSWRRRNQGPAGRRQFRARVDAPRPASAWLLVTVASATLWITQQLEAWALALQVGAILGSLARRRDPFAWQRSPLALNVGMLAIAAATIAVALRGGPSTIALAHFAALTQGLQLLDARPRQTEFLLVTLALFQVILASNLTDSVFFPPLLATFVFAVVWTLLVHTLRSETIEAGDPRGMSRAITPGLLHMTLVASGLSVLLALVLFVALPRLRSNMVRGTSIAPTLATAGFSDHVTLGELGRIRLDPTLVMRIETLEGVPPAPGSGYWRGLAFDRFDGSSWSITPSQRNPVAGSAEGGIWLGRDASAPNLVQRIVREPVEAGVLFSAGEVRELQGAVRRLERDASGGLYAAGQANQRVRYRVATRRRRLRDEVLRRDAAVPERRLGERHLQLPQLSPAVARLAGEIARGRSSDADRVRSIEQYLLRNGRYTNLPPSPDPKAEHSAIEAFLLGELAGHCEYFATSMVVLLRTLGIPARLVNGFAGGAENEIGGFLEITRSDAHTWAEVHYAEASWVRYDPTPPDLRARPAVSVSLSQQMRQLASALELWWFHRVVGFDRSDQIRALKRAWLAWRAVRERRAVPQRESSLPRIARPELGATLRPLLPWLALAGVALAGLAWRSRHARGPSQPPVAYAKALRLLARRGLRRGPATTARDFAARVGAEQPGAVAAAFDTLTEVYLAERFGGRAPGPAAAALDTLRASLRRRGIR